MWYDAAMKSKLANCNTNNNINTPTCNCCVNFWCRFWCLWPPLWFMARQKKNSATFLHLNLHNSLCHISLSKHLDLCLLPFCQWLYKVRNWHMLPCPNHRISRSQVAWPSWPIRLLFLHNRVPHTPPCGLSNKNMLEKLVQTLVTSSPSIFSPITPFGLRVPTLASNKRKRQRSPSSFGQIC